MERPPTARGGSGVGAEAGPTASPEAWERLARTLVDAPDDDLCAAVCRELVEGFGFSRALIATVDAPRERLVVRAGHDPDLPQPAARALTSLLSIPLAPAADGRLPVEAWCVLQGEQVHVADASDYSFRPARTMQRAVVIEALDAREYVLTPLPGPGGTAFGLLAADLRGRGRRIGAADRRLLDAVARLAGVALAARGPPDSRGGGEEPAAAAGVGSDPGGPTGEADEARREFLYMIVHDLNTPLQSIVGFAELLLMERGGELDDTQRDFLRRIEAGGWQMTELVRHILDVTQLESGAVALEREAVAPRRLVEQALDALAERGLDPTRVLDEVPADLPPVHGDSERLAQAVEAVLRRALEISPPDARVRLTGELDARQAAVRLHVEDGGPVLAAEEARHLFDAVWTVCRARDAATRRRALRLAVVRLLLEAHGGSAEAVPLAGGAGTRVTLTLPVAGAEA